MSTPLPADIQSLISHHMATGLYASEEEVLRVALESLDDDSLALQSAIDEWQQGDSGIPVDEAFDLVRRKVDGGAA